MAHVDEPRLAGLDLECEVDSEFDGEVGGVMGMAEGVEDEDFSVFCGFDSGGWDVVAIGVIGEEFAVVAMEDEAFDGHFAVGEVGWDEEVVSELEGAMDCDRFGADVGFWGWALVIEGVGEDAAEGIHGCWVCVDGHAAVFHFAEAAEVIKSGDVVNMGVGIDDGVEFSEFGSQALVTEIGGGIEDEGSFWGLDEEGGAEAFVARVGGGADAAGATDYGDAGGGASSEKCDCKRMHFGLFRRMLAREEICLQR